MSTQLLSLLLVSGCFLASAFRAQESGDSDNAGQAHPLVISQPALVGGRGVESRRNNYFHRLHFFGADTKLPAAGKANFPARRGAMTVMNALDAAQDSNPQQSGVHALATAAAALAAAHGHVGLSGAVVTGAFKALAGTVGHKVNMDCQEKALTAAKLAAELDEANRQKDAMVGLQARVTYASAAAALATTVMQVSPLGMVAGMASSCLCAAAAWIVNKETQKTIDRISLSLDASEQQLMPYIEELAAVADPPQDWEAKFSKLAAILSGITLPSVGYALAKGAIVLKADMAVMVANALVVLWLAKANWAMSKLSNKIDTMKSALNRKVVSTLEQRFEGSKWNLGGSMGDLVSAALASVEDLSPAIGGIRHGLTAFSTTMHIIGAVRSNRPRQAPSLLQAGVQQPLAELTEELVVALGDFAEWHASQEAASLSISLGDFEASLTGLLSDVGEMNMAQEDRPAELLAALTAAKADFAELRGAVAELEAGAGGMDEAQLSEWEQQSAEGLTPPELSEEALAAVLLADPLEM